MTELKVTIEMNERQAAVVQQALEEWFRIRMGQFNGLANDLAFYGYQHDPRKPDSFDARIDKRQHLEAVLNAVKEITWPFQTGGFTKAIPEVNVASDIWSVLRHELYIARGGKKNDWTRDSFTPFQMGKEPLPKIQITKVEVKKDGVEKPKKQSS